MILAVMGVKGGRSIRIPDAMRETLEKKHHRLPGAPESNSSHLVCYVRQASTQGGPVPALLMDFSVPQNEISCFFFPPAEHCDGGCI